MPCAVDYILEGLANNLELERELGVFSLEFDRGLLASLPLEREVRREPVAAQASAVGAVAPAKRFDFVFLHHGPIRGGDCTTMMAKVIKAMKLEPESAPVVFTGDKPAAKIYVVLGVKALKMWYGGVSLTGCGWFRDGDSEALLVYSPEDIYRFGSNLSEAMKRKKREMWGRLQEAMRKVGC